MQKITRHNAGVMLASDVLAVVDRLAVEQSRSRSFIINQLLRESFKLLQLQNQRPAPAKPDDPAIMDQRPFGTPAITF